MDLKNNGKAIIHKQYDFYNPNAEVCAGKKFQQKCKSVDLGLDALVSLPLYFCGYWVDLCCVDVQCTIIVH